MDPIPPKAVFLSYAHEDAGAARRIAEALRANGLEVWFDESELRGGDAWDAKIRRQIKECALFLPVISANTQKRPEGYFRLEWHLAEQRSHLIARGRPFILPVVVDGTTDADALVPDAFLAVQWTRLAGGETLANFREHVRRLLAAGPGDGSSQPGGPRKEAAQPRARRRAWLAGAGAGVILLGLGLFLELGRHPRPVEAAAAAESTPSSPTADRLLERAHAVWPKLETTRNDCLLAADLLRQAAQQAPDDAEIAAAQAQLDEYWIQRGWDTSDARLESATVETDRAIRLNPASFEVRLAQAQLICPISRDPSLPPGILPQLARQARLFRALLRERPKDQRVLRDLADALTNEGLIDEADAIDEESARLPGGDPLALYDESLNLRLSGRTWEAEAPMRAAIAQHPFSAALLYSALFSVWLDGDLKAAKATLDRVDPSALLEDRGCFVAYYIATLCRDPDAALERLQAVPRDWISDFMYRGPKAELVGDALQLAGRSEAAAAEWQAGLDLVEQRLASNPANSIAVRNEALLLARLGRMDEAERKFAIFVQLEGIDLDGQTSVSSWVTKVCVALGRKAEAIHQIAVGITHHSENTEAYTASALRLDPTWDPLRSDPDFQRLLAQAATADAARRQAARKRRPI